MVAIEQVVPVAREIKGPHVFANSTRARAFAGVVHFIEHTKLQCMVLPHPAQVVRDPQPFIPGTDRCARVEGNARRIGKPAEGHLWNELQRVRIREELPETLKSVLLTPEVVQIELVAQRPELSGLTIADVDLVDESRRKSPAVIPRVCVGDILIMVRLHEEVGVESGRLKLGLSIGIPPPGTE